MVLAADRVDTINVVFRFTVILALAVKVDPDIIALVLCFYRPAVAVDKFLRAHLAAHLVSDGVFPGAALFQGEITAISLPAAGRQ